MNENFKYKFNKVNFYEYTIRMTVIDNTEMFLVSDLLKQYNEINHTNKHINDYFRRKDTQDLLNYLRKSSGIFSTHIENFVEEFNNYGDIPKVIQKINYKVNNITNKTFIVNAAILHDILMWCDKVYSYKIYNFLENLRKV